MITGVTSRQPTQLGRHVVLTLRRAALVASFAAATSLASTAASAADERSVVEIQEEIARLKQQLEAQERALADKSQTTRASAVARPAAEPGTSEENRLGKVTVRARNRLEPLKDVPLAISVVTGSELERLNAFDIDSITKRAANVAWNQGNQRTSSLSIRGIGKQGQTEAQDPSVGVVVDGVNYAYNALTSSFDFTDVETVEVSRGPQGTLLGKNTSLGVVNIATKKPSFEPSAEYGVTIGDRDTVQGRVAGGGPIVDDLVAWRGTLTVDKGRGDIVNRYNRDQTWQNKDRVFGKLQLLITPTDTLSIRLAADKAPRGGETTNARTINLPTPAVYSNGSPNTALTNEQRLQRRWFSQVTSYTVERNYWYGGGDNSVNYDFALPLVTGSSGGLADVNWTVGNFDITSISAYKNYHFDAVNDEGTPFDVYRNAGGFWNDYEQWSQELRVSSQVGDLVDYQTGLFFLKVRNDAEYRREWGNDAGAWFASNAQYARLDTDSAGRLLMQSSLDGLKTAFNSPAGEQHIRNDSKAAFAQANWHLSEAWTLTTGARVTREDRHTRASSHVKDNGVAPELNPVAVNGVSLGGFDSTASGSVFAGQIGAGSAANLGFLNTTDPAQIALADLVAQKYFGVATYNQLTGAQAAQVAAAKAIRQTAIGVVFPERAAQPFEETQYSFVVAPSYKINDRYTAYLSWQYGEKAGISQFVNGVSFLVPGEDSSSYELGLKSVLFDKTLTLNLAAFYTRIKNYQQAVRVADEYTTANNIAAGITPAIAYTTATGSVPRVISQGLEIDAFYAGIPYTTLRFSGAYNDAYYDEFTNSAQPVENGYAGAPPYRSVSGETLPGAYKWSLNTGVDFHYPIFAQLEIIGSFNAAYNGKSKSDNSLSSYSWLPSKTIVDLAVGLGRVDRSITATLVAKNVFDDDTPLTNTWNSYTPAFPRWVGIAVTGRL